MQLRSVSPEATPEEVAAIVAALAQIRRQSAASGAPPSAGGAGPSAGAQQLDHWRVAGRLAHRRVGMARGPWRLSGRLGRRVRA